MLFKDLKISDKMKQNIDELGFTEMMPIQKETIEPIFAGKDVVGQAQTGTGKTAAFAIPTLEMFEGTQDSKCLVIAPTRELALQIVEEYRKLGKKHKFTIAPVVGGMDMKRQKDALRRKPTIIVGTPGRLLDHLSGKRIDMTSIKTFVIDEVDEMFKSGFKEEIDKIIAYLPKEKQMLLFSATISDNVKKVVKETCDDAVYVTVSSGMRSTKTVTQQAVIVKESNKFKTLIKFINFDKPGCAIIFGRTKRRANELAIALRKSGIEAGALHGDMSQKERNLVTKQFKAGDLHILVATDVAARGLDVNNVTHVYNFDLPQEVEYYVHRIGRTGRAGKSGKSLSFVKGAEQSHVERIMKESHSKIEYINPPSNTDLHEVNKNHVINEVKGLISKTNSSNNKEIVEELLNNYDNTEIASVLVDMMLKSTNDVDVELTSEPGVKIKSFGGGRGNSRNRNDRGRSRSYGRNDNKGGSRNSRSNGSDNRNTNQRDNRRRNTNTRRRSS